MPTSLPRIARSPATFARNVSGPDEMFLTLYVVSNWREPFVYETTSVSWIIGEPLLWSLSVQTVVIVAGLAGVRGGPEVVGVGKPPPTNLPNRCTKPLGFWGSTSSPKPALPTGF